VVIAREPLLVCEAMGLKSRSPANARNRMAGRVARDHRARCDQCRRVCTGFRRMAIVLSMLQWWRLTLRMGDVPLALPRDTVLAATWIPEAHAPWATKYPAWLAAL
jgi:hypothetical protein